MRNLVIYTNETFEEEKALYDLDEKKILLNGDCYHNKIDYVIGGYLFALGIDKENVENIYIGSKHKLFQELDFYNDNYDEDDVI